MTTTTTGILPYRLQLEEGERLGALDDPGPLPEGMHQNPTLLYAANALISRLRELPGVFVDFNTFVYYDRTNRNRRVSSDLYVALGVDTVAIRERHGYLIWEVGKAPDFVLEIASESTARYDCIGKRDLYASLGVGEYWRYDSTGGDFYGTPLVGEQLVNGEYRPFEVHTTADGKIWAHSPVLDIDIYWGDDRLRVYDPDSGSFKLDAEELEQQYKESEEARGTLESELTAAEEARSATQASHAATEAAYEAERAARMRAEAEIARLQDHLRRQQS